MDRSARNTANQQTVGYTRQGVLRTSRVSGGVDASSVIRFGDHTNTQQKWASHGSVGEHRAAESYFRQLEEVMGLKDGSIKVSMGKFLVRWMRPAPMWPTPRCGSRCCWLPVAWRRVSTVCSR